MARDQHTVARYLGCLRAGPRFHGLVKPSSFPPLGIQPSQMKGSFRAPGRGFSGFWLAAMSSRSPRPQHGTLAAWNTGNSERA
jgi:hypothetical protein